MFFHYAYVRYHELEAAFSAAAFKCSKVKEFGLSIGRPRALLQTWAGATPNALETPNKTV